MMRLRGCHVVVRTAKGLTESRVAGEKRRAELLPCGRRKDGEVGVLKVVCQWLLRYVLLLAEIGQVIGPFQLCSEALIRRITREGLGLLRIQKVVTVVGKV